MKEKYEKPQILFEDMRLSTAVATKCTYVKKSDGTIVPWDNIGAEWGFLTDQQVCSMVDEKFCYHNPDDMDAILIHDVS